MARKGKIQILRNQSSDFNVSASDFILDNGEQFYDGVKDILFIGDGNTPIKDLYQSGDMFSTSSVRTFSQLWQIFPMYDSSKSYSNGDVVWMDGTHNYGSGFVDKEEKEVYKIYNGTWYGMSDISAELLYRGVSIIDAITYAGHFRTSKPYNDMSGFATHLDVSVGKTVSQSGVNVTYVYENLCPSTSYVFGVLEIVLVGSLNRCACRYTAWDNNRANAKTWYGEAQNTNSTTLSWSGWKEVLDCESDQVISGQKIFYGKHVVVQSSKASSDTTLPNSNTWFGLNLQDNGGRGFAAVHGGITTSYNALELWLKTKNPDPNSSNNIRLIGTYNPEGTPQETWQFSPAISASNVSYAVSLGGSSRRWKDLYLYGNLNQTLPIQIGTNTSGGTNSIAIGDNVSADGDSSIAVGVGKNSTNKTSASGKCSVAMGYNANASSADSVTVGNQAHTSGAYGIAIGTNSNSGNSSISTNVSAIAIGQDTFAEKSNDIAVGNHAHAMGMHAIAIGCASSALTSDSIAIGTCSSTATGTQSIAIGNNSGSTGASAVTIGKATRASGNNSMALGAEAQATASGAIQLGKGTNSGQNTLAFGCGGNWNRTIVDSDGKIHANTSDISDISNISYNVSWGNISNKNNTYGPKQVLIGEEALGCDSSPSNRVIAIGSTVEANAENSICIGFGNSSAGVSIFASGNNSIALGYLANASAENSVQIGEGNNATSKTLKFRNREIVDGNGKINADSVGGIYLSKNSSDGNWIICQKKLEWNTGKVFNESVQYLYTDVDLSDAYIELVFDVCTTTIKVPQIGSYGYLIPLCWKSGPGMLFVEAQHERGRTNIYVKPENSNPGTYSLELKYIYRLI